MPSDRTFSPGDLAERYGVKAEKVIAWIRAGELAAINTGNGRNKPRWRVTAESLAEFERRRSSQADAPSKSTRRRTTAPGVIEYY